MEFGPGLGSLLYMGFMAVVLGFLVVWPLCAVDWWFWGLVWFGRSVGWSAVCLPGDCVI